jgi:hypothetical protein
MHVNRCEYLPRVARRGNAAGVGGLAGASMSHKIGTIKMFYHFNVNGHETTFVDILDHVVTKKEGRMYIIDTVPSLMRGKHRVTSESTIYHIDSITSKVLLAPHYDPLKASTQMCVITMWEAR